MTPNKDEGRLTAPDPDHADGPTGGDVIARLRRAGLRVLPLPQIPASTAADARQAVTAGGGMPALFPGLAHGWPALAAWDPAQLAIAHGGTRVTALMDLPATGVLLPEEQCNYERALPFAEFVQAMLTASPDAPCYLAYTRVAGLFPAADYDFGPLTGGIPGGTDTRVWIGSAGTRSMLHSDLKDNLFCQIWGEKEVVLLPWQHSRAAYPFPDNIVNSRIDVATPDLTAFPRLGRAVLYAGTVRPGDVLFMPRGCWHDIRSLTPSVSLNHWFGRPLGFADYAQLLARLGPPYWAATARSFLVHGLLHRRERTRFLFSPPSTGKRMYDLVRWGDFSRENDPSG